MAHDPPLALHPYLTRLLAVLALPAACGGIAVLPDGEGGGGAGGTTSTGGAGGNVSTCGDPPPPPMGYTGFSLCYGGVSCTVTPEVETSLTNDIIAQQDPSACEPCGCYVYDLKVVTTCAGKDGCCFSGYAGVEGGGCVGRPFVVGCDTRLAAVTPRGDWSADLSRGGSVAPSVEQRAALARAWADDGRFEHASIASFARHVLELLSLGAPAELVLGAQQAMGDEIEHARLCFGLAARYGEPVGPGLLDVSGALPASPARAGALARAAESAVREGCVTETLSALLAARARDLATEPEVRAALARIADDEWRHAELAWRFVRWALAQGGEDVRAAVRRGFAEATFRPSGGLAGLAAHGRLSTEEMESVAKRGLEDVVAPCVRGLFGALPTLRELAA